MQGESSCLLALVLVCGVGQAGASLADGPTFIGRLPQGTVELVGVTFYPPTEQSQWWKPDGSAAHLDSFLPRSTYRLPLRANEIAFAFLVRFENLPADASRQVWGITPWAATWGPGHWSSGWGGGCTPVVDYYGKTVSNYQLFSVSRGASDQTADLRVGIAKGAWETVITQNARSAGRRTFSRDGEKWTVIFQKATVVASGGSQVRLAYTVPYGRWNMQLVAVASDGSEYSSSAKYGFTSDGSLSGSIYRGYVTEIAVCNVPLSSIKEFRLQVRPYDWVEFNNVSLQPGQKTDVRVFSPKGS
jgi:hypothetical protein